MHNSFCGSDTLAPSLRHLALVLACALAPLAAHAYVPPTGPGEPATPTVEVNVPDTTITITDPAVPVVIGPNAAGARVVVAGAASTTAWTIQVTMNGQALQMQARPGSGTEFKLAKLNGSIVPVLESLTGWLSLTSSTTGQAMVLAGPVLLSSGHTSTAFEAKPRTLALQTGSLKPSGGALPQVGAMGLQGGERLLVDAQGALVSVTLGSLDGGTQQAGDAMAFPNLPGAIWVQPDSYARMKGALARLSGADLTTGLGTTPSGAYLLQDSGVSYQLLPTLPITIDATQQDGLTYTAQGMYRWVRGGVVVDFAPAVTDLVALLEATRAAAPGWDVIVILYAEGVVQLNLLFSGNGVFMTLKPDWVGTGLATGTPAINTGPAQAGGESQFSFQIGQSPKQNLSPTFQSPLRVRALLQQRFPGKEVKVSTDGRIEIAGVGYLKPNLNITTYSAQIPDQGYYDWIGNDTTKASFSLRYRDWQNYGWSQSGDFVGTAPKQ